MPVNAMIGAAVGAMSGRGGASGGGGSVRKGVKLTTDGKLVGDVFELCNGHGGQKLGKATVCMWVKANLVPNPMPGAHSNAWGIIKSASLYAASRYVQGYTGTDGIPAQRQRFQYDVGGGTIDDASQTPNGHGYMPNSMLEARLHGQDRRPGR
jgi:hypothetical protein